MVLELVVLLLELDEMEQEVVLELDEVRWDVLTEMDK